jgi:O-antigen ligase
VRVLLLGIAIYTFFAFAYGPLSHGADTLAPIRKLYYLGVGAALIACVDFYFQAPPLGGFGRQFVWLPEGVVRRAQGFFYDAGMLGNLCVFFLVMLALAVLLPAVRGRLMSRKALLVGCALFPAALLLSFSRSSLLNLAVSLGAVAIVHRAELHIHRRRIAFTLAAVVAGLLMAALLFPGYADVYMSRIWHMVFRGFIDPEGLLSGRLQTWRELLDFLSAHPWYLFLGIGFKTLPYMSFAGRPLIADNMYLSILVETGFVGLVAMMLFSAAILKAGFRAMRSPMPAASFLGAWIFCFWIGQLFQMLFVDVLTYWRVLPLYFAVLGLAVRETARAQAAATREV